ncbi:ParB-like nuclease domain-containing protein [Candidatus Nitrososphaera gargensis Ga9.2]|uniref:ParB-like nuclease domain-containing protein n=1 Tax=Nitrososphaera gargensis (strain Ga9.2) TaxID=1237085 RepID=K0IGK1_NITGG|nr:ParB N-terminal domain-containing protein [Candidatus Nitrososphaera gargensis]AFU58930.1 ParB-like nuclease domain-containing protein [Candidatus Nitrososphaera gargensis Ga9.2]
MKSSATLSKNSIQAISLDHLKKNGWNCNTMTKEEFESLKTSMKIEGQVNPVLVTPRADYFLIIDGEKRFDAAIDLGWKSLQAIVEDSINDDQVKVRCFTSHYNRGFLDPIKTFKLFYGEWMRESSKAYDDGEDEGGSGKEKVTTRQLEQKYGVDQSWISRILTIREIPEPVRNYISSLMRDASKRFSITHAIVLAEKAQAIPEVELKKVVDYFFSPQNKKVESYTDLRFLLETVVQELHSKTPNDDDDDVADGSNRQDSDDDDDNEHNEAPSKTGKGFACSRNGGSFPTSRSKSRHVVEGNFDCEGCDSHYMIDWNNKRVLKLTPEDTFVRASEVQALPTKVTDGCPRCGNQISIDFEGRTFRWI